VALFASWLALRGRATEAARSATSANNPERLFMRFSLLSLGIIYGVIILSDPWRPFGNPRMAAPLLAHLFLWAVVLLRLSQDQPVWRQRLVGTLAIGGFFPNLSPGEITWFERTHAQERRILAGVEARINAAGARNEVAVCMQQDDYWNSIPRFIGPTLYAQRHFLSGAGPSLAECDVVISPAGRPAAGAGFERSASSELRGKRYTVSTRSRDSAPR
jgi:hypothetical protein